MPEGKNVSYHGYKVSVSLPPPLHKDSFCGSSYGIACNGSVNDTGEDAAKYSVK